MKTRQLGHNGPKVSAIGLGAMSFGGIFGDTTEAESLTCLDAMYDAGINFIDTANIYGMGVSETIIGQWLRTRRPNVTIATKASFVPGLPRRIDNSEGHLRAELEASLKRLGRDHVDLFYIHRREHERPLDEVIGGLKRLIEEGGDSSPYWQHAFGKRPAEQLFDLSADPDCVTNLASDAKYSEKVAAMNTTLVAELRRQNDPRIVDQGAVFDEYLSPRAVPEANRPKKNGKKPK